MMNEDEKTEDELRDNIHGKRVNDVLSDCYFAIEQPPIDPNLSVVENLQNLLDKTRYIKYNRDKDAGFFSEA